MLRPLHSEPGVTPYSDAPTSLCGGVLVSTSLAWPDPTAPPIASASSTAAPRLHPLPLLCLLRLLVIMHAQYNISYVCVCVLMGGTKLVMRNHARYIFLIYWLCLASFPGSSPAFCCTLYKKQGESLDATQDDRKVSKRGHNEQLWVLKATVTTWTRVLYTVVSTGKLCMNEWWASQAIYFRAVHRSYVVSVDQVVASFPGPIRGGEKGLVSTVCACA